MELMTEEKERPIWNPAFHNLKEYSIKQDNHIDRIEHQNKELLTRLNNRNMKYEKEFRKSLPETIGEKDHDYDLSNYIDWIECQFEDLEHQNKELREYEIIHKDECDKWEHFTFVPNRKCTCGLDKLLTKTP